MPRPTPVQQLAALRSAIAQWRGRKAITIYQLSESTGLSIRRCEVLCQQHHLDVRRNARETRDVLSDQYCEMVEGFREWCGKRSANFRTAMIAALGEFMRRRARSGRSRAG